MKKRILFLLHYPPPVHGSAIIGAQIMESKIINERFSCRYVNMGTSKTIDEIGQNAIGKIFRYFLILNKVLFELIMFRPALCYVAITAKGVGFYKDSFMVMLVKLFHVKIVYHFHNKGVSENKDKTIDNKLYRFIFKNAKVVLLSPRLFYDIDKYVDKDFVYYCPNGIPAKQLNDRAIEKSNNEVEILFLSNLIESKGVFILLEACKLLKNRGLKFHCTFVGGESDITAFDFQQKGKDLEIDHLVQFVGKKYDLDKQKMYLQSDIFVFPTYYETFGIVNLEAMQYSIPIVSTFEGGIPDVVENGITGYLVPQKDAKALADKLEILINNKGLRAKMGAAGRIKYEQEFTLQIFENRLLHILNLIMTSN